MPVRVDPADWKRVLAKVTGRFVCGQHRVASRELLIQHLGAPVTDKTVKRLRPIMHELGWHGPQMLRFDKKTLNGYWRPPMTVGSVFSPDADDFDFAADVSAVAEGGASVPAPSGPADALPRKLERVTLLGLEKIEQILRMPTDVADGNLLRAQTTAALGAVNSQLRADETRLRAKQQGDVLERLLKVMAVERKKLAAREDGETEAIRLKDLRPSDDESKD